MTGLEEFAAVVKPNEPLAPYTALRLGGPAEALVEPRSVEELAAVVRRCLDRGIRFRVLGSGSNVLVGDAGVRGVVLRLTAPDLAEVRVNGQRVRAGGGAALADVIAASARQGLAGLELLVGIGATVGGALRSNAGDRSGEIGQFVRQVEVLDGHGELQVRDRDELHFGPGSSNLDDPVLVAAEFELEPDQPAAIVKRMRKAWIQRKAARPLGSHAAGRVFQDPRGLSAAGLIEQAGLGRTRVGGAEISERDANYVVAHPGATARDVLRLIDLVRSRVREQLGVALELEMDVW